VSDIKTYVAKRKLKEGELVVEGLDVDKIEGRVLTASVPEAIPGCDRCGTGEGLHVCIPEVIDMLRCDEGFRALIFEAVYNLRIPKEKEDGSGDVEGCD